MKFVGQLLGAHAARYPGFDLPDVYKLLHQAALGPAHAVEGATARERLAQEAAALGPGPHEPIVDPISPDGRLARIHLRPYAARGLMLDALADAFAQTAQTWPASIERLAKFCGCLGELADAGGIAFARTDVEAYMNARAAEGWPAIHHSPQFHAAWQPAYRVVDLTLLPDVEPGQTAP
ncbi:MAG: hypothetical protein ABI794_17840 [Betaproteobacteria bacterium]